MTVDAGVLMPAASVVVAARTWICPPLRPVSPLDGLALGAQQIGVVEGCAALEALAQVLGSRGQILRW